MKTKTFDCIQMKREAQQRLLEELSKLSQRQQLDYFKQSHEQLVERQKQLRDPKR